MAATELAAGRSSRIDHMTATELASTVLTTVGKAQQLTA